MADGTKKDVDLTEQDINGNKEEDIKNLQTAIELDKRDREVFEKNLNELRSVFYDDLENLDLEFSENVQGIESKIYGSNEIRKRSSPPYQGTRNKSEYAEQNCNKKLENEIPNKFSKVRDGVQELDQNMYEFETESIHDERSTEEMEAKKRVIELFPSNHDVKKNTDNLTDEFGDFGGRWDDYTCHLQQSPTVEAYMKASVNGIRIKYELMSLKEAPKEPDQSNDRTDGGFYKNIEEVEQEMGEQMRKLGENGDYEEQGGVNKSNVQWIIEDDVSDVEGLEFDKSRGKFTGENKEVTKKDLDEKQKKTTPSDEKSEALELISNQMVHLETEIASLQADLMRLLHEKERVAEKYVLLKSELVKLKEGNCEKELKIFELVEHSFTALLAEPVDRDLRNKFQRQMKKIKAKLDQSEKLQMVNGVASRGKSQDAENSMKVLKRIRPAIAVVIALFCLSILKANAKKSKK